MLINQMMSAVVKSNGSVKLRFSINVQNSFILYYSLIRYLTNCMFETTRKFRIYKLENVTLPHLLIHIIVVVIAMKLKNTLKVRISLNDEMM
ncbi:uncharacterized protein [Blastocystis hominis]|uniref:Uncharacterized protein n=1 Tax=Blastocystis hominis TaxID=12968 RepID=D8M6Z8_BLAHO|nr:uncharacterized protein [Blastocystis hominis]CBK23837.2 unnamed protein product [Blastocystis hominis]|eukprot:XP_012897885.1 uncharacterized protein [Blastocystis hominis]